MPIVLLMIFGFAVVGWFIISLSFEFSVMGGDIREEIEVYDKNGIMWVDYKNKTWVAENRVGRKMHVRSTTLERGGVNRGSHVVFEHGSDGNTYFICFEDAMNFVDDNLKLNTVDVMGDICDNGK